ncbi:MAG: T9SS type A sorting domain-containing protein [Bacteroidetes bacterium]|nr:T9SS type A sorting domain-containing protein [Bacteroidota bacterium]
MSLKSLTYKAANGISPDIMYADSTVYYYHIVTSQEPLMAEASAIMLYPNPAKDMVQLHCETPLAIRSMSIRNSAGVPIYESAINLMQSLDLRIALPNLTAGYYSLCFQRKGGSFETKKLLIVK